jgi:hypothetical protein
VLGLPALPALAAEVTLKVEIPRLPVAEYHRPYVAVWLERGSEATAAAQLAVWYDLKKKDNGGTKWLKDMRQWWRKGGRDLTVPADGVSGATRAPGEAVLNLGNHKALAALPAGEYQLVVEASRENGGREVLRLPLQWPPKAPQTAKAQGEGELGAVQLSVKP